MPTQADKGRLFRELHERKDAFIIPNPWDAGTARMLAHLGFEALATTSAGFAFSQGQQDNAVDRQKVLEHIATIVSASNLPVSADLENGFGDSPEIVAETIRLAAAAGAVGGSIEDATGDPADPIYDFYRAVERVQAAAKAARDLPFTFTLTARAENYMQNRRNLQDTISRLQAYGKVGADVLYAPGLSTGDEIAAVVRSVKSPG